MAKGVYRTSTAFQARWVDGDGCTCIKTFASLDAAIAHRHAQIAARDAERRCVVCAHHLQPGTRRSTITCSQACRQRRKSRRCPDCGAPVSKEATRCEPCGHEAGRRYERARVVAAIRDLGDRLERTPTLAECKAAGLPQYNTFYVYFASYREAVALAGLVPRRPGERVSPDSGRKVRLGRNRQMVTGGYYQARGVAHVSP